MYVEYSIYKYRKITRGTIGNADSLISQHLCIFVIWISYSIFIVAEIVNSVVSTVCF